MRSVSRHILGFMLGSFVFSAALLGLAGPAAAHDAAESSTPAQGTTVPAPPDQVSVTYSNKPLGIGASFSVKDSSGIEWAQGPVEIVDNVASQSLRPGGPAGGYTVSWRVVSSDSHPIEGTFSFTAAAAAEGAAAAGAVPGMGTAQPGQTAAPAAAAEPAQPFQWSIVVFAAVALGLLVALAVLAKRRLSGGADDAETQE
jgi:methionine-rich copper-binding protein CopC